MTRTASEAMRAYEKELRDKPKTTRGSNISKAGWKKNDLGDYINDKGDILYKSKSFKGRGGEWVLNGEKIPNSSRKSVAMIQQRANYLLSAKTTSISTATASRGTGGTSTSRT